MAISKGLSALVLLAVFFAAEARGEAAGGDEGPCEDAAIGSGLARHAEPAPPRWNVASNPLGWLVGLYGASGTVVVAAHLGVRADVNYYMPVATESRGFELGAGLPIYLEGIFDGPFVEPGVIVRRYGDGDAEAIFGPQLLVGWQLIWRDRLNAAAAIGMGRDIRNARESSRANLFANGYVRFGYAF